MIRVGIVRGGNTHSEHSLRGGGRVLRSFLEELVGEYKAIDIFISADGVWHVQGIPTTTQRLPLFVDVLFSMLTGVTPLTSSGIHMIEATTIPHTAHKSSTQNDIYDYLALRTRAQEANFIVPPMVTVSLANATIKQIAELVQGATARLSPPYAVRPRRGDSHHDAWIVQTGERLLPVLTLLHEGGVDEVVIEEYTVGDVLEAHAIPDFRNAPVHVFLPVRHSVQGTHLVTGETRKLLEDKARALVSSIDPQTHTAVFARVHPRDGIVFTSLTVTPDLSDSGAFHTVLEANGVSFPDYLRHRVALAKKGKKG